MNLRMGIGCGEAFEMGWAEGSNKAGKCQLWDDESGWKKETWAGR
jgi:hypothetical protein